MFIGQVVAQLQCDWLSWIERSDVHRTGRGSIAAWVSVPIAQLDRAPPF